MAIGAIATVRHDHTENICVGTAPPMGPDTVCTTVVVWPGKQVKFIDSLPVEVQYNHPPSWLGSMENLTVTVNGVQVETTVRNYDIVVTVP